MRNPLTPPTRLPWTNAAIESSIAARFEAIVALHPRRVALQTAQGAWSYAQLDALANRLAREMMARVGGAPVPVILFLPQNHLGIAALLAGLKAGYICVPLDVALPAERLTAVWQNTGAPLIVCAGESAARCLEVTQRVLDLDLLDLDSLDLGNAGAENGEFSAEIAPEIAPDSLAYLIYTSGSTGRPKGVMQSHRNLLHHVKSYSELLGIGPGDRLALLSGAGVGQGLKTVFNALLNGASLHPFEVRAQGLVAMSRWLKCEEISIYVSTPTLFRHFLQVLDESDACFPQLRLMRLGGEALRSSDVAWFARHRARFAPDCALVNALSSTETGHLCLHFVDVERESREAAGSVVPVGRPVEGVEIQILGEDRREVRSGETGEIVVTSRTLSPGYWRADEDARDVLMPCGARRFHTGDLGRALSDGSLGHMGRRDAQLKIRGFRVEPAEIEVRLQSHPTVAQCAVGAGDKSVEKQGDWQLTAYIVASDAAATAATESPKVLVRELRAWTGANLPAHMVPTVWVFVKALPLTMSGKLDRRALLLLENQPEIALDGRGNSSLSDFSKSPRTQEREGGIETLDSPVAPPRNTVERQLAVIWERLLGVECLNIHDDFFDLGGDSLKAAQMMDEVSIHFGQILPLQALLAGASIAQLAHHLRRQHFVAAQSPLLEINARGTRPPLFFVHGDPYNGALGCYHLAHHLGEDQPVFVLPLHGATGRSGEKVPRTIEEMASLHLPVVRAAQQHGPYFLAGYCLGGVIAFELALQLRDQGERVEFLGLIHTTVPVLHHRLQFRIVETLGKAFGHAPDTRLRNFQSARRIRRDLEFGFENLKRKLGYSVPEKIAWWRRYRRRLATEFAVRWRAYRNAASDETARQSGDDWNDGLSGGMAEYQAYGEATARYMPRPYVGCVTLFWPCDTHKSCLRSIRRDWRDIATELVLHWVPGDHDSCMDAEHVASLAARIRGELLKRA